jgi:hypothetical protein
MLNPARAPADLKDMLTLLLLFAMKVAIPSELACVGSIQEGTLPLDTYVAAVEMEGIATLAVEGQVLYLNGPKVSALKAGTIQRVVRPEGKVHDPLTGNGVGYYYRDIGTIKIVTVEQNQATARVLVSCQGMLKGDLVLPYAPKPEVEFGGEPSSDTTVLPQHGLASSILLGKDDLRELASGSICFLGLGAQDGVKAGDRFIVFRPYPAFNSKDMAAVGTNSDMSYSPMSNWSYRFNLRMLLHERKIPPQILGDIVVVETGDKTSTGKVVNSLSEIHIGDLIVKK